MTQRPSPLTLWWHSLSAAQAFVLGALVAAAVLGPPTALWALWRVQPMLAAARPTVPAATLPPPTATATPSATVSPSPTATASATPTPSPTPSPTPVPTATLPPLEAGGALVIGYSVEGRPLTVYRFGQGPHQRLIVAGIHGGYEWNTVALAETLLARLQDGSIPVPEAVTLFLLPNLNPDGYARQKGALGRANARGVDLNRNFPWNWAPDWDRAGCWNYAPITAGSGPFSEPETRALRDFLLRPDVHPEALVSYHSAALGIFPGGWPQPHPPSVELAQTLAQATGYPYPPMDYGCQLTGQLVDWTAWVLGIPSVDIELSNHRDIDWPQARAALQVLFTWQVPGLLGDE